MKQDRVRWLQRRREQAASRRNSGLCPAPCGRSRPAGWGYRVFPEEIRNFKNLEILDLSMNKFEVVPNWINELSELSILTIAYSPLKKVPESIGALSNLSHLELLDNKIEKTRLCFQIFFY